MADLAVAIARAKRARDATAWSPSEGGRATLDLLVALAEAGSVTPTPAPTPAPTIPPTSTTGAARFRDSIGVATHGANQGKPNDFSQTWVQSALADLAAVGLRHIRDGWGVGWPPVPDPADAKFLDLHRRLGLKITFVCDPEDGNDPVARVAHMRKIAAAGALEAIELANEPGGWLADPNVVEYGWKAKDWAIRIRDLVRADSAFDGIPLVSFALADALATSKYQAFGLIPGMDMGAMHNYAGAAPGTNVGQRMNTTIIRGAMANARILAGAGKPIISTETGWPTMTAPDVVTEAQQADYTAELYRMHFAEGVWRTFNYVLVSKGTDVNRENGFGLLRADGFRKPVFAAVRDLIAAGA